MPSTRPTCTTTRVRRGSNRCRTICSARPPRPPRRPPPTGPLRPATRPTTRPGRRRAPPSLTSATTPSRRHPPSTPPYAARYRLTLKGPDRGKWEADVRAEADAPLLTVDAVVRGVQRRAGESADSERLDGEQFRALLPEPEWSGTTSSSSTR